LESQSAPNTCWVVLRDGEISLKEWDDGSVMFDEANGQLRCLTPASGALMAVMLETPKHSTQELASNLFGADLTDDDLVLIGNALEELCALGLVGRVLA